MIDLNKREKEDKKEKRKTSDFPAVFYVCVGERESSSFGQLFF